MLAGMQMFVQRRYHLLLMGLIGLGFVLLFLELVGYRHFEGLQLIGISATVVGAVASFLGITARGRLRSILVGVFLVLALTGLFGTFEHNESLLGGERREGAGQFRDRQQANGQNPAANPADPNAPAGQPNTGAANGANQPGQNGPRRPGFGGQRIPAPPLAPLSLSGFCLLGMVALLGKKDE